MLEIPADAFRRMSRERQDEIIAKAGQIHTEAEQKLARFMLERARQQLVEAFPGAVKALFRIDLVEGAFRVSVFEVQDGKRASLYFFESATDEEEALIAPFEDDLADVANLGYNLGPIDTEISLYLTDH